MFRKAFLPLVLFVITTGVVWAGPFKGKQAPAFNLKDEAGKVCSLKAFEGQAVLLKIGTTWCPQCATQSDQIISVLPELQGLNVAVLEIFLEETVDAVSDYRRQHHLPQAIRTCLDSGSQVLEGYEVSMIPRVLLLDKNHRVLRDDYLVPADRLVEEFKALR